MFCQWLSYDLRPDQPIRNVFKVAEQRSTTQINQFRIFLLNGWATTQIIQFAVFCQWLSYDLRPRQTNMPHFLVAELRYTTMINQFAMFFQWLRYDLLPRTTNSQCILVADVRPRSTNSQCFSVAELRSTTKINPFSLFCQWLSYQSTKLCLVSHWVTI